MTDPKRRTSGGPKPVESLRHDDRRRNLPTGELSHLVDTAGAAPAPVLYPRDASLDPQLVWRGKDSLDCAGLAAPAVPIFLLSTRARSRA